ncbi:DUF1549 domain-containing protein [Rubritalea spongiae]|uniref:DUF1549 domain-containing protein n=1 Tax=Rubritalea spongiae TaxID=430797 RepID=A0ABW5DXH3_9BACT
MITARPILILLAITSTSIAKKQPLAVITNAAAEIDYLIEEANTQNNIAPNSILEDSIFLRRAYLNITGRIPTYEESKNFLDSSAKDKRAKLIEQLTYSPGFNSHLFNFYANLLRLKTNQEQFGLGWHVWLRDAVKTNQGYDTIVNKMLSATGHCSTNPAVGYYLRDRGMLLDNISNTSKVFLGTQIGCAQCHDDPFEDWTQKQYYQLAAFGSEISYNSEIVRKKVKEVVEYKVRKDGGKPTRQLTKNELKERIKLSKNEARDLNSIFRNFNRNSINLQSGKKLTLPADYKYNDAKPKDVVTPNVLFGSMPTSAADSDKHQQMADWITSPSNPMFSKVIVNRLWKHALGYGLVEPVDNWTDRSNIAHEEVIDILVQILHTSDFDVRETLRVIYHTKLFQREACDFEITDGRIHDFRGPLLRRMSSEELYDSLITLAKGNIDNLINEDQLKKWANFQSSIQQLVSASPQEIIKLDNQADIVEDALREPQNEAKKLRAEKDKAIQEGDTQREKQLSSKLKRLYEKMNDIKKAKQSEQMEEMSMVMQYNLRTKDNILLRASEMPQPFKPGSLPRDFGGSDRETTNAQHTHASIPQALTMLNGKQIDNLITQQSRIGKMLKSFHRENDRLNVLFLSIYNSYPTSEEEIMLKQYSRSKQEIYILAKAMLNSKRFLFVQ